MGNSLLTLAAIATILGFVLQLAKLIYGWTKGSRGGRQRGDLSAELLVAEKHNLLKRITDDLFEHTWRKEIVPIFCLSLFINVLGGAFIYRVHGVAYFDMCGTALSSFTLGPWWAATIGLFSNLLLASINEPNYHLWSLINVLGGLIWGYAGRTFFVSSNQGGSDLPRRGFYRMVGLGVVSGIFLSLAASYIRVTMLHVHSLHIVDSIYTWMGEKANHPGFALRQILYLVSDTIPSIPDKTVSVVLGSIMAFLFFPFLREPPRQTKTMDRSAFKSMLGPPLVFFVAYAATCWSLITEYSQYWILIISPLAISLAVMLFGRHRKPSESKILDLKSERRVLYHQLRQSSTYARFRQVVTNCFSLCGAMAVGYLALFSVTNQMGIERVWSSVAITIVALGIASTVLYIVCLIMIDNVFCAEHRMEDIQSPSSNL